MASIKPLKEQAMVTGRGGIGLDASPTDRRTRESELKVRSKKLKFKDLSNLIQKLILQNDV